MGSSPAYDDIIQQIIDIPEKIEPALWPECCIYNVPTSLLEVKKEAYTPLLISIGPTHHGKKKLVEMQLQKKRYFCFFLERGVNKRDLEDYRAFLEQEEQSIRHHYQKKFPYISKEKFANMILLDAIFIMELFLRKRKNEKHEGDYILTQPCLEKNIQRDLLLLENQLPIHVLEKLYETVVPSNVREHARFIKLAYDYFSSCYSHQAAECETIKKSVKHFTDLVRCCYLPKKLRFDTDKGDNDHIDQKKREKGSGLRRTATKSNEEGGLRRTATKLNEAGVSFEKVEDRCLLDIGFENKPFSGWFLCLGCLPFSRCFKARFQFPQLKVDHTTECVLRNLIALEQCHYPEEPYICNYVSLIDSLIHTKDDAELLVEKEAIVHVLGSDKELATLVNSLCKHVVTDKTCYQQVIRQLNEHYDSPWKWAMGTLRTVYFRDPWRSSSTIVGIAVLIFTIFNFCRVIRVIF